MSNNMKYTFFILLIIPLLNSCIEKQEKKQEIKKSNPIETSSIKVSTKLAPKKGDTIIIKQINKIEDYQDAIKSISYVWITEKDTLDFKIHTREFLIDGTKKHVHINIEHHKKIRFATALKYFKKCLPSIEKEFALDYLGSLQFEGPFKYLDFKTTLPKEYEKMYGNEKINYLEVNNFLMKSSLNVELKKILHSLKKEDYNYRIEKFEVQDSNITGIGILIRFF